MTDIDTLRAELETVRADMAETRQASAAAFRELGDIEKQITAAAHAAALPPLIIKKRLYIDLGPAYDLRISRLARREAEITREIARLTLLQGVAQDAPPRGMSKGDKRAELHRRGLSEAEITKILNSNLP